MKRYSVFCPIQRGPLTALDQAAIQLQRSRFTGEARGETIARVREALLLHEAYRDCIEFHLFPAIEEYEPALVALIRDARDRDLPLYKQVLHAVQLLENMGMQEDQKRAGMKLTRGFTRYMAAQITALSKQEEVLSKPLWHYYSDEELQQLVCGILYKLPACQEPPIMDLVSG